MKPIYLLALRSPYLAFKKFYESNTQLVEKLWAFLSKGNIKDNAAVLTETVKSASTSINYDSSKKLAENLSQLLTSPTTNSCFQVALLYYPIKATLTFVNDAIINPLQPECIAKARADLYFQHHPKLYLKAAASKTYECLEASVNYLKPARS